MPFVVWLISINRLPPLYVYGVVKAITIVEDVPSNDPVYTVVASVTSANADRVSSEVSFILTSNVPVQAAEAGVDK